MGGIKLVLKSSISASNLCVSYKEFFRTWKEPLGKIKHIDALSELCFDIPNGDVVGLIGKNGAGKSTLLKCIAGMIRPVSGSMTTEGRTILLSGADPGFFQDSTGRQNVIELAKAYGVEDQEIEEFCQSIFDFANLGDAIDRNVRGYSTGMRGKLGFGFITALRPEILLIDETLGVGDAEFRVKAQNRLKEFVKGSGTVVISTHSLGLAKELCNKGILLDSGKNVFYGKIEKTLDKYREILS